ncbi:hypothetical protein PMG11_09182 [Penicillium brasilianum]|uniref:Protein kinase domain-containing protein n=1 Tax=Penicillium brasilianum TaxID=104259 RepID=A0A0F7TV68_PENBI|nr:hypothetical protein PMG11_09182 [Penicillium brasilianum]
MFDRAFGLILAITFLGGAWIGFQPAPKSHLSQYGACKEVRATGATATVFRYQLNNGSSYAVKRFRKKSQSTTQEDYLSSVRNEVEISNYLSHKRIMPTLDFFDENRVFYSVMPYVPITLFDRIMRNTTVLLEEQRDCIFRQIVDAIVYMHSKGAAHLDLKLNNILLEDESEIKVIDFGNSRVFQQPHGALVKGLFATPPNAPYEAYQDGYYDPFAGDVWAVGMIYCQMTFPLAPWNMGLQPPAIFAIFSPSVSQAPSAIDLTQLQATVEMISRNLPERARSVIGGMLRSNPQDRISMNEVLENDWIRSLRNCE